MQIKTNTVACTKAAGFHTKYNVPFPILVRGHKATIFVVVFFFHLKKYFASLHDFSSTLSQFYAQNSTLYRALKNTTVELQWLEHLQDHGNMFETRAV